MQAIEKWTFGHREGIDDDDIAFVRDDEADNDPFEQLLTWLMFRSGTHSETNFITHLDRCKPDEWGRFLAFCAKAANDEKRVIDILGVDRTEFTEMVDRYASLIDPTDGYEYFRFDLNEQHAVYFRHEWGRQIDAER